MIDNIEDNIENNINSIIYEIIEDIENNNLFLCGICLEIIEKKNNCITNCNHRFCLSCILISVEYKNNCPTCRKKLYSKFNPLTNILYNVNESETESENQSDDDENIVVQQLLLNTTINQNQSINEEQMTEEQITLFIRLKKIIEYSYRFSYIFTRIKNAFIITTKISSFIILTTFCINTGFQLSNYFLYHVCNI